MIAASQATASPIQRRCHIPRARAMSCSINSCISTISSSPGILYALPEAPSKPALGNKKDVPRLDVDVRRNVAALDQVLQPHPILTPAFGGPHDGCVVAIGEI